MELVYNGINTGIMGQLFSQITPNGGLNFIVYLIPHGIFEMTATVLESTAGILLFLFIYRFIKSMISKNIHGAHEAFEIAKPPLFQSIMLMIVSTILLLIAAPIEAYFSVPFSDMIVK